MLTGNTSDHELLKDDDEGSAFQILYNRYWEALYKKALDRTGSDNDAQEIVQDIFVSCWRNRTTIKVDHSLEPYLFAALKYAVINYVYRQAKKGRLVPLSLDALDRSHITTEELLAYKDLRMLLDTEVKKLPTRMQQIYRLSKEEHLQLAEIALTLNISEQTVKNTLTTALRRLREQLIKAKAVSLLILI